MYGHSALLALTLASATALATAGGADEIPPPLPPAALPAPPAPPPTEGETEADIEAAAQPDEAPPPEAEAAAEGSPLPAPVARPEALPTPERERLPQGWTLREVPGNAPVALAGGPGQVASLTAFCLAGAPWLALQLQPQPEADAVRVDFGFSGQRFEVDALREEGADDAYVAELAGTPLAELLSGADSSASLAIDGTQQGRLSLAGSSRAIRAALAGCHAF